MPIYAYRCGECGHELDALQKLSEPALTDCPACGRAALAKKLTAAGFQLKGSGWYATDFRSGSKPAAADTADAAKSDGKSDTAAGNASAPAADSKSDSKAESKAESKAPASASGGCGSGCACH